MIQYQALFLNGPSSSGKTSFARAFQEASTTFFLLVEMDQIIAMMPKTLNDWSGEGAPSGFSWKRVEEEGRVYQKLQMGPYAKKIAQTFRDIIILLLEQGYHIIIDVVVLSEEEMKEWKQFLSKYRVLYLGITAPLEVIEIREKKRGDRIEGSAAYQHKAYKTSLHDLEIDTDSDTESNNIRKVIKCLEDK